MNSLYKTLLLSMLALLMLAPRSEASHISGGDMSYTCIGQDSFLLRLALFRDCSGITMSTNQTVTLTSTCGGSITVTLNNVPNTSTGNAYTNISQLCSSDSLNSTCFGGTLPGMQEYIYEGIVVLTPPCDTWTAGWSTCCRNTTVNVPTSNSDNVYVQTTMNTATNGCNNSPAFTAQPIPYVCINQPVSYSYGVVEPDGDSLVYSLIPGLQSATLQLVYGGGYSGAVPIPGMTIDPNTGLLNFTPTVLGNFIVTVLVEEFDSNGNLLGTIMRDIQFIVQNCPNTVPGNPVSAGNITGQGNQIGPMAVELCEGNSICFDLTFSDPDVNDTLTFSSTNLTTVLPGATMTVVGTNPAVVTICWQALPGSPSFNAITIDVNDGACPVAGISSVAMEVHVVTSTYAGPDQTICGTQAASINATGGSIFDWTVLSGPPMQVGTNFSCTPCSSPIATPTATTTYVVVSDLSGNCVNTDTITINVVPDFSWTSTTSASSACLLEDIDLNVVPNPGGAYTYQWSPGSGLSNPNIANPTASVITPGTNTYYVTMTSPQGCVHQDSVSFTVAPNYQPDVTAPNDTIIDCTDSAFLNASMGASIPVACGISATGCGGAPSQLTVGTGTATLGTTAYPAPFGNFYNGARHQILYLASELQGMGFNGGQITELAFDVAIINGLTNYANMEIRMGCTNSTSMSTWESGFVTVRPAAPHVVTTGWNTFTFTNAFDWDGISNIIVEICFDQNGLTTWTNNSETRYTPTAYNSVLYFRSDAGGVCYSGNETQSPNRPNTRFTTCGGVAPPGTYTYEWSTSVALSDSTILTPSASPVNTTTYIITVTDNIGGCSDSDTMTVFVNCGDCQPPEPVFTPPTCNGSSDAQIVATPVIVYNPVIFTWYDNQSGVLLQTSQATTQNDTLSNIPAGEYLIVITDTALNCIDDTLVTILDPPVPTVQGFGDTTICIGGTAVLSASAAGGNGAPFLLNWDNGLVGNGPHSVTLTADNSYVVFATDTNGCPSLNDTVFVTLNPPLTLSTSGNDTICDGDQANLLAFAGGGSGTGYTYLWEENGAGIGSGPDITVTPTASGTQYCVTLTDDCETPPITECLNIEFHPDPVPTFDVDVRDGCFPVGVNFTNTTDPALVGSVNWDFNNGETSTNVLGDSSTFFTPGCYDIWLEVTSPEGCTIDTTYDNFICSFGYPIASFAFGPQPTTFLNTEIEFTNLSVDNTTNEWTFYHNMPDGAYDTSDVVHPIYEFPNDDPGAYDVQLVVTNDNGCTDTARHIVIIDGEHLIYVPNSFTPNGDGVNDFFFVQGEGIDLTGYELLIYDRWGNLIFEAEDANRAWDGKVAGSGVLAEVDVYVWKLKAKDLYTGEKKEHYGHVTVVR